MRARSRIRLLIADVDGTLLTSRKELTEATRRAVHRLHEADIALAITSGRPPRGMSMLVDPLALTTPIAAFNGGLLVTPELQVLEERTLRAELVHPIVVTLERHGLDVWVYRGADWFVTDLRAPHVDREQRTVRFAPSLVPSLDGLAEGVVKLVGVSDDAERMRACEDEVRQEFGDHVSASRSQSYYLDVTHPEANKGTVVTRLSERLQIATAEIATIGDMPNDVLMFSRSGLSIAMGNASPEVQRTARRVTDSNDDEGFARAVDRWLLRG